MRCEMKGKWTLLGSIVVIVVLALAVGLARAQGPQPPGEGVQPQGGVGIQALMGTAFTYQGQLKKAGNPVSGTCDFQFSLWDAAGSGSPPTGGNQIGITQTATISVTNGLFTAQIDFGADAFQGNARWLQIAVKCAGDVSYTTLSPRQPLTPAPYALALPGLWTQQHDTSPNLIGGYSGNSVTAGVYGATIGGGGSSGYTNVVTGSFSTVGGGRANTAGEWGATVAGGVEHKATGRSSTIGGGNGNTASAYVATVSGGGANSASADGATVGGGMHNNSSGGQATVGGGVYNTASGYAATIGGGESNLITATALYGTIGGGESNTASGSKATVGGGSSNTASNWYATVGGGWNNTASGYAAAVGGGYSNTVSSDYATIPGGSEAAATHYGEMAYAAGAFGARGDAQTSVYVLRGASSGTTQAELFLDGSSRRLTIASGRTVTFDILVVGRSSNGESAGYRIIGVIENVGGTTTVVGTVSKTVPGEDDPSWDVTVDADDTNDALRIRVQGGTDDNVRWVATVRTVEVSW